jgi:hypothetical protein
MGLERVNAMIRSDNNEFCERLAELLDIETGSRDESAADIVKWAIKKTINDMRAEKVEREAAQEAAGLRAL